MGAQLGNGKPGLAYHLLLRLGPGGRLGSSRNTISPLTLRLMAQVGVRRQAGNASGNASVRCPFLLLVRPLDSPGGLLALRSNMGSFERQRFALLPELDLGLKCQLMDRLALRVGYSLLYLTEAVRTGDQIDAGVNPTLLPNSQVPVSGPERSAPQVKSTSLWAQSIQAGCVFQF